MKNNKKAFTMIELIVVLFIISIFFIFAEPKLAQFIDRTRQAQIQNDSLLLRSSINTDLENDPNYLETNKSNFTSVKESSFTEGDNKEYDLYLNGKKIDTELLNDIGDLGIVAIPQEYVDINIESQLRGSFYRLATGNILYLDKAE